MPAMYGDRTAYFRPEDFKAESSVITIFDGMNPPFEVDLRKYHKDSVTFGRDVTNDIYLSSPCVSRGCHGLIYQRNGLLCFEDMGSTNGLIINGRRLRRAVLYPGTILRIEAGNRTTAEGVMIMLSAAGTRSQWNSVVTPPSANFLIGRSPDCSLRLEHVGVSRHHAVIRIEGGYAYISDLHSTNGVFVNGFRITAETLLSEKDIITITSTRLIYSNGRIFYCTNRTGIGVNASHLVKQVKSGNNTITICNDVSLSIEPGQLVAIIGGSGRGRRPL